MKQYKPLPMGIDNFEELITKGYYFADKTKLIGELLEKKGKVNLFTRPRRFGKTLSLSMLRCFFEDERDAHGHKTQKRGLFKGLSIMYAEKETLAQTGQYPVISLTLKSAKQPDFAMAYASLCDEIAGEYRRHSYVLNHTVLLEEEICKYKQIMSERADPIVYAKSLKFLTDCLKKYHRRTVILEFFIFYRLSEKSIRKTDWKMPVRKACDPK